jgi:hypothetical protein
MFLSYRGFINTKKYGLHQSNITFLHYKRRKNFVTYRYIIPLTKITVANQLHVLHLILFKLIFLFDTVRI